jgi:hypothetical protein
MSKATPFNLGEPDAFSLPMGYGFRKVGGRELQERESWEDLLLVWEAPRKGHRYVVSVDVSDGMGRDRSVVEVTRVGTVEEPDEQVAQFVTTSIIPLNLAPICDTIGRFYASGDRAALMAVECNNSGLAVQNELQAHLGYRNFFVWQYADAANPARRFSTRIGWYTTPRTRPIILTRYHNALTTLDPISNLPEYQIHSPFTVDELRDFQIPEDGAGIGDATAGPGAHDDCIMAGAIGLHVSATLYFGTKEPLSGTRRRLTEEREARMRDALRRNERRDYRNTDVDLDEIGGIYTGVPGANYG